MYLEEFDYLDDFKRQMYIQGEASGLMKGLVKGKYDQAVKTAKNLLSMGLGFEQIAKATELDINVVSALA